MLGPTGCFFLCKKQQYQGEIALVTNLRPLMFEQLLKERGGLARKHKEVEK